MGWSASVGEDPDSTDVPLGCYVYRQLFLEGDNIEVAFRLGHRKLWPSFDECDKARWCARRPARCGDATDREACEDSCLVALTSWAGGGGGAGRQAEDSVAQAPSRGALHQPDRLALKRGEPTPGPSSQRSGKRTRNKLSLGSAMFQNRSLLFLLPTSTGGTSRKTHGAVRKLFLSGLNWTPSDLTWSPGARFSPPESHRVSRPPPAPDEGRRPPHSHVGQPFLCIVLNLAPSSPPPAGTLVSPSRRRRATGCFGLRVCLFVCSHFGVVQKGWGGGEKSPKRLTCTGEHKLKMRAKGGRERGWRQKAEPGLRRKMQTIRNVLNTELGSATQGTPRLLISEREAGSGRHVPPPGEKQTQPAGNGEPSWGRGARRTLSSGLGRKDEVRWGDRCPRGPAASRSACFWRGVRQMLAASRRCPP